MKKTKTIGGITDTLQVTGFPELLHVCVTGDEDLKGEYYLDLFEARELWREIKRWCDDQDVARVESLRDQEGKNRL